MNEQTVELKVAPHWASLLSSFLVSWLVFYLSAFLIVIGLSAVMSGLGKTIIAGSPMFIIELIVSGVISFAFALLVGNKFYRWFAKKSAVAVYLWLGALIITAALSFPGTYNFTDVQDIPEKVHVE